MLGVVYVIYDDGRPLVEAYDGPQIVGMDLHRRRSVLVRMTEDGRKLGTARITNSPARLAAEIARAGLHPKVVLEACYGWYWAAAPTWAFVVERVTGIEPALSAWEADVLPLNYTRAHLHCPAGEPACTLFAQTWYRTR